MKKLDIKKIVNHLGCTEEELANQLNIPFENLKKYGNGDPMPMELLLQLSDITGLLPNNLYIGENASSFIAKPIVPNDTFVVSSEAKNDLLAFIKQGLEEFKNDEFRAELKKLESCVKSFRKPRISFAGQSDAGKSTLINSLLGAERMPAKWTPTTSIVVYIKHIADRPVFMKEDVWIFGRKDGKQWDEKNLNDETYCNEFVIEKGDFSLLETFGTHQNETDKNKDAACAVTFIDSPLLKDCDILDLPGFGATAEDDALHKFNTQENETDILLYLSRSNGFLQDRDLDYLKECIKSLRPVEQKDVNNIPKLGNLYIIASQAGAVNNGNATELNEILDRRCEALCNIYKTSPKREKDLLPFRSEITGYSYTEEDFRKRFFTYEKSMSRLCEKFDDDFRSLAETLPEATSKEFFSCLSEIVYGSSDLLKNKIAEWEQLRKQRTEYAEAARSIRAHEPARVAEQSRKNKEIIDFIDNCSVESKQAVHTMYGNLMDTDSLIALMKERNVQNKKSSKEEFSTLLNQMLSDKVQAVLSEEATKYTEKIDKFLKDYTESLISYANDTPISIEFDSKQSFATGLAGLGALGASAAWLTTSFTAWSVFTLGSWAGLGPILAVGGVIGIAIGGLVVGILSASKLINWRKSFASGIIKAYDKGNFVFTVDKDIDQYWKDTKVGFEKAAQKIENDWRKLLNEYEELADENSLPALEKKIDEGRKGLNFLSQLPLSSPEKA